MICRVCLRLAKCPLHIFDGGLDIAAILQQHFWFEPMPNDGISELICHCCWVKIRDFHEFYMEVEKVHLELHAKQMVEIAYVDETATTINKTTTAVEIDESCSEEKPIILASNAVQTDTERQEELWRDDQNEDLEKIKSDEEEESEEEKDKPDTANNPLHIPELEAAAELELPNVNTIEPEIDITTNECELNIKLKRKRRKRKAKEDESDSETVKETKPKRRNRKMITNQDDDIIKKHIAMGCDLCPFVADNFRHMIDHFEQQHPNVRAYIKCCDRKFTKRFLILQHAYKHEDPEFFKCEECQKNFSDTYVLRAHILAAHAPEDELKFACDECPKRFSRRYMLEMHKPSHIPKHERKFICSQCPIPNAFASDHLLLIHTNMRHTKATNVCHVCAKEIRDNRSYEKHVRLHFEDSGPRIKCPLPDCDRWLKDEDNLKQHMRRHHEEGKVFTCDECGKVCKNRRSLTSHLNYAHTSTVFACDECNKTFKKAITLREHMAQHTGESLYKCPFCPRTFNSNANMHSHKKKMHPVEWDIWRKTKRGSSQHVASNKLVMEVVATSTNSDTIDSNM